MRNRDRLVIAITLVVVILLCVGVSQISRCSGNTQFQDKSNRVEMLMRLAKASEQPRYETVVLLAAGDSEEKVPGLYLTPITHFGDESGSTLFIGFSASTFNKGDQVICRDVSYQKRLGNNPDSLPWLIPAKPSRAFPARQPEAK